jgi:hypothetical protein
VLLRGPGVLIVRRRYGRRLVLLHIIRKQCVLGLVIDLNAVLYVHARKYAAAAHVGWAVDDMVTATRGIAILATAIAAEAFNHPKAANPPIL